jgi:anthranilate synthase/aminodeoxychorismate synthase-like glutamine amidotransferase
MILIVDNYDSFTYNLVQLVGSFGGRPVVFRNDRTDTEEISRLGPERILISPGPGTPDRAGISNEVIRTFQGRIPILGVCLGMQAIGHVYGARIRRAERLMHGKTSRITHEGSGWLEGVPSPFEAMRYNSLIVDEESLPDELVVTARSETGEVMGLRHRRHLLEGVQFHPESYRSPEGPRIIKNFLRAR